MISFFEKNYSEVYKNCCSEIRGRLPVCPPSIISTFPFDIYLPKVSTLILEQLVLE